MHGSLWRYGAVLCSSSPVSLDATVVVCCESQVCEWVCGSPPNTADQYELKVGGSVCVATGRASSHTCV
jgi:hypothetical protein